MFNIKIINFFNIFHKKTLDISYNMPKAILLTIVVSDYIIIHKGNGASAIGSPVAFLRHRSRKKYK